MQLTFSTTIFIAALVFGVSGLPGNSLSQDKSPAARVRLPGNSLSQDESLAVRTKVQRIKRYFRQGETSTTINQGELKGTYFYAATEDRLFKVTGTGVSPGFSGAFLSDVVDMVSGEVFMVKKNGLGPYEIECNRAAGRLEVALDQDSFIMEKVNGLSLGRILSMPMSFSRLEALFDSTLSMIQRLHRVHNVFHGDFHSSNVMITSDDEAKAIDFGKSELLSNLFDGLSRNLKKHYPATGSDELRELTYKVWDGVDIYTVQQEFRAKLNGMMSIIRTLQMELSPDDIQSVQRLSRKLEETGRYQRLHAQVNGHWNFDLV